MTIQKTLRKATLFIAALMASFSVLLVAPALSHADGVGDGLNQLKNSTGNSYPNTVFSGKTPAEIFGQIINIALGIAFAVAVIMVIYGGYQYITSAGNEEKATAGRQTLIYALIGIVIVLLSFVIVNAVLTFVRNGANGTGGGNGTVNTNGNGNNNTGGNGNGNGTACGGVGQPPCI